MAGLGIADAIDDPPGPLTGATSAALNSYAWEVACMVNLACTRQTQNKDTQLGHLQAARAGGLGVISYPVVPYATTGASSSVFVASNVVGSTL